MDFEDILEDVGSYGPYQRNLIWFFTAPVCFFCPFLTMALIFVVSVPDHWCKVPDVLSSNLSIHQQRSLIEAYANPECLMNDINYTEYITSTHMFVSNYTNTTKCIYGWEYDKSEFDATAATKWNMVCEDNHFPSFVLSLQNMGGLILTPIYGALADRCGRRKTFFIVILIAAITEISSILTSSFIVFSVMKALSGGLLPSMMSMPYILASELVTPRERVFCNGIVNTFWMVGMCFLPLVVYLCRSWIILGIVNTVIGVSILLYWKFIPESPVWLVSRERYKEALNIMIRIGKKNDRNLDKTLLIKKLKLLGERVRKKKEEETHKACLYITKYPRFRTIFLIITFCWIANLATYNGLQYNVMELEGNEFFNFFLLSIVEGPGNFLLWFLMEKIGRRWSASFGFFLTAVICIIAVTGLPYSEIISSILGKCIISGVFMVTDQQSCELYPTVFRSSGIGLSKTVAKATTLLVPYLIYLGRYGKFIPFVSLSLLCMFSAILSAFLPESLNENLPQNISDAENVGKNQKFFSFNRNNCSTIESDPADENVIYDVGTQPEIYAIKLREAKN